MSSPSSSSTTAAIRDPAPSRLLLLAHGSRNPQWAQPMRKVLEELRARQPGIDAELCFLESMEPLLVDALQACAEAGSWQVLVVPLFLGQGNHLRQDVVRQVEAVRECHPRLQVRVAPAAGDSPLVLRALADYALEGLRAAGR